MTTPLILIVPPEGQAVRQHDLMMYRIGRAGELSLPRLPAIRQRDPDRTPPSAAALAAPAWRMTEARAA